MKMNSGHEVDIQENNQGNRIRIVGTRPTIMVCIIVGLEDRF